MCTPKVDAACGTNQRTMQAGADLTRRTLRCSCLASCSGTLPPLPQQERKDGCMTDLHYFIL